MDKYIAIGRLHFNGEPYEPGELVPFKDGDEPHIEQLLDLGRIQPADAGQVLDGMTIRQLGELAKAENVEVPEKAAKAAIKALILTARSERASAAIAGDQDGQRSGR